MSDAKVKRSLWPAAVTAVALLLVSASPASGGPVNTAATPGDLADALDGHPVLASGASWHWICSGGSCDPAGTKDSAGGPYFPTSGGTFSIMTSGDADGVDNPPQSNFESNDNGSPSYQPGKFDVLILRVDLSVPAGHNTLVFDFQLLSEEFPSFVGSCFVDSFFAELDATTWTGGGCGAYSAPNNFAKDQLANDVTINTPTILPANGVGTTYNGGTCKLTATRAITPGPHSLFLTVFDSSDGIYDTAVFLDNLRTLHLETPSGTPTSCNYPDPPGAFTWLPVEPDTCADVDFTVTLPAIPGPFTVTWSFGDASPPVSVGTTTVSHKYAAAGLYTVTMSLLETLTGQVYAATEEVQVVKCILRAKTTDYVGTVGIPIPILGSATGAKGDYSCGWKGLGEDAGLAIFSYLGSCSSTVLYEYVGEYEIQLTVTDHGMEDQEASAIAKVLVLPDDPEESISQDPPVAEPVDGVHGAAAQADVDEDGIPDRDDSCIAEPNVKPEDARDSDGDGLGDLCDPDRDGDGALDVDDSCLWVPDDQADTDADGEGDACDGDDDADGVADLRGGVPEDNCRLAANPGQEDLDADLVGDICDDEADGDGVVDLLDAFPADGSEWSDLDGDGDGDNADPDDDNDGLEDTLEDGLQAGNAGRGRPGDASRVDGVDVSSRGGDGVAWTWVIGGFALAMAIVLLLVVVSARRE